MKKLSVLLITLFSLTGGLSAQVLPIYTNLYILPADHQPYKNFEQYDLGTLLFYNGIGKEAKYCYIIDRATGAKIFELNERDSKARKYVPTFLGDASTGVPYIIMVSLEGDFSQGSHVLVLEEGKIYQPGFLYYGVDNFNFASIGLYCQFEKREDGYLMFFQEDASIIKYATEELIDGANLEFLVTRDKITRVK